MLDKLFMQLEEFGLLVPICKTGSIAEVVHVTKITIMRHKLVYLKSMIFT